jgi:hypothetical protein
MIGHRLFTVMSARTGLALAARFLAGLAAARRSSWTTRRREVSMH